MILKNLLSYSNLFFFHFLFYNNYFQKESYWGENAPIFKKYKDFLAGSRKYVLIMQLISDHCAFSLYQFSGHRTQADRTMY